MCICVPPPAEVGGIFDDPPGPDSWIFIIIMTGSTVWCVMRITRGCGEGAVVGGAGDGVDSPGGGPWVSLAPRAVSEVLVAVAEVAVPSLV